MRTGPRWLRCLAQPGARLWPLDASGSRYGVYPGGDRRRRPVAKVDAATVQQSRAVGWISEQGAGYVLAPEGASYLERTPAEAGFAAQHRDLRDTAIIMDGRIETAVRNANESPLARWMKPGLGGGSAFLTVDEFAAGERFREDYLRSTLTSRVTANWTGQPSGSTRGSCDPADAPVSRIAAKDRVFAALDALGPGLDRVLLAVCIRETSLDQIERDQKWPARSGKLALKLALGQLARHYGIARPAATAQAPRAAASA